MVADDARRPRTARATLPNKGLEMAYRKKLLALMGDMQRSVLWWIGATYKSRLPEIVQDSSPSRELERELLKVMTRWEKEFDKSAQRLSRWFVRRVNAHSVSSMQAALRDAGVTVKMRNTRAVNNVLQSLIIEQTNLIKSIPGQYVTEVRGLVMHSVREGRDMGFLKEQMEKRYGIDERRAITIARDQTNKATEGISRVRNKALGITQGIWMHRGGGKVPRQSHMAANGKIFDLSIGLMIDGETIFPGEMVNCHCTYKPVIPPLNGEVMQA